MQTVTHLTNLVGFLGAQLEDHIVWDRIREDTIEGRIPGIELLGQQLGDRILTDEALGPLGWSRSEGDISEAELKGRGNSRDTKRERRTLLNHLVGIPHQRLKKNIHSRTASSLFKDFLRCQPKQALF